MEYHNPRPSEDFLRALITRSSRDIDCTFCGRYFFSAHGGDYEHGELDKLRRKSAENPDKIIEVPGDSVEWGYLDGRQAVADCDCGAMARYEQAFWKSREVIEKFLANRVATMRAKTGDELERSASVTSSVQQTRT